MNLSFIGRRPLYYGRTIENPDGPLSVQIRAPSKSRTYNDFRIFYALQRLRILKCCVAISEVFFEGTVNYQLGRRHSTMHEFDSFAKIF